MKIAAAQIRSVPGDIEGNIERHVRLIERAGSRGSAAVFFPEMSLTAYEPRMAEQLAMTEADARLDVLQALSDRHQMLIAVGAPYRGVQGPEIGMFIFRSRQARAVYSKQMLHADERPYFTPGTRILPLTLGADTLVPAICFESLQRETVLAAKQAGATVYVASVAKHSLGMQRAYPHYATVAREHAMVVMVSNGVGHADGFEMSGQSAAWGQDGALVCSAGNEEEALVVYDLTTRSGGTFAPSAVIA